MPVERFAFMPGGVVQDQDISFAFWFSALFRFIQKYLEHFRENVHRLNSKKFTGSRTYHSYDVHSYVVAVFGASDFSALFVPSPARPWIPVKAGFIGEPDVQIRLFMKFLEHFSERLALLFILSIRPGLRHFEGEALFVEKSHHRFVAALHFIGFGDVSMEGFGCPKIPICILRIFYKINKLLSLIRVDFGRSAWAFLYDQTIKAQCIKSGDPVSQTSFSHQERCTYLFPGDTGDKHLDGRTPQRRLPGSNASCVFQLVDQGVLGVRF